MELTAEERDYHDETLAVVVVRPRLASFVRRMIAIPSSAVAAPIAAPASTSVG
jgi:hypothetical protein